MSAFGGKADMAIAVRNVRLWPKADMANRRPLPDYWCGLVRCLVL